MIKLVKNVGQCKALIGECRYLLYTNDFDIGELYAKPSIKSIIGYVKAKMKGGFR